MIGHRKDSEVAVAQGNGGLRQSPQDLFGQSLFAHRGRSIQRAPAGAHCQSADHIVRYQHPYRRPVRGSMLVARGWIGLHQLRGMGKQKRGSVQQKHRSPHTGKPLGLLLQGYKQQVAHFLCHLQGQFAARLTVGAGIGRQRLPSQRWHKRPYRPPRQLADGYRESAFGVQALKDHQPDHHPGTQRPLAGKRRRLWQHRPDQRFRNGLPVSLERPGQRQRDRTIIVLRAFMV